MIVLGYSGLDASVRYARRDPDLLPGEERIVQGLDSAAAILADGRIVAAAAEERFGTEKHTNAFPQEAIQYCLNEAGISMGDVDMVAHGFGLRPLCDDDRRGQPRALRGGVQPDPASRALA